MELRTGTTAGSRETAVIRGKLGLPPLPERFVARPRVERSLAALIERHRVVLVLATAGAGKTTAVVEATRLLDRQLAWLTVDRTDVAPGRLVVYLEAALAEQLPELRGVATRALAAGIPHAEAAGLLADAVGDSRLLFVVDELERLEEAGEAWAVIETFVRYAPPGMRTVLISRRAIPPTLCALPAGGAVAAFGEEDLAFTPTEAGEALANLGKEAIDAAAAVEATGGWVTGVLFEAWRSADHVAGTGGEADPLHGYLSSHIVDQLDREDRDFLVATSLLNEVSAQRAAALGLRDAGERLVALRTARLPVTWGSGGHAMRCHSRFREYLLERLERRDRDEVNALRLAHGRLLAQEGHHEEATEELLLAGAPSAALASAEQAIVDVIERLDFAIAERWLELLAQVAPSGTSAFTTAELMLAGARDDYRQGVRVADQLGALGERERLARSSERAAALMAWCYLVCGRLDDAQAVLAVAEQGPEVAAVRYNLTLHTDPPDGGRPAAPELTGGPLDALILVTKYLFGRLSELDDRPGSRWLDSVTGPWRIAALRATGRTQQALELYEAIRETVPSRLSLSMVVGPELLLDAGRHDDARQALARGLELARASGAYLYELGMKLVQAKLALRLEHDTAAARAILDTVERDPALQSFRHHHEYLDTWYGLAQLLDSADAAALPRLRRAVEGMLTGDRMLELPTAAVYLAEAEWRAGDEEAADRAANVALEAARRQGSNHLLLQALADFPAVVSRRIDAEPTADSPWHELGRALIAQGLRIEAHVKSSLELKEFDRVAILLNGKEVRPAITKSYELLAYLSLRREAQSDRDELLDALFDGRSDDATRSYLRQAVRKLREVLPDETVIVEPGSVRLSEDVAITVESTRFETQLAEAARLQGKDRLAATLQALAIFDRGEYLPVIRSAWADERRRELSDLAAEARFQAAETAFAAGLYTEAQPLNEEVLRVDPFREAAWRLRMRIANALGDEDGVIAAFQACERALADLDADPSPATRELLANLRR